MGYFSDENRPKVVFDREIAEALGINCSIILCRLMWSIDKHFNSKNLAFFKNNKWWMYDSKGDLSSYSGLTEKQIRIVLSKLKKLKIIETGQFDRKFAVRRNWFYVDESRLRAVISSIGPFCPDSVPIGPFCPDVSGPFVTSIGPFCPDVSGPFVPIPLYTKNHTKSQTESQTKRPPKPSASEVIPPSKIPKIRILKHTPEDLIIAKKWLEYASREMSWSKLPPKWTEINFAEDIAKVREATDLNHDGITALLEFIENDSFWCKNAWAPIGLLKKAKNGEGIRKIDNILKQMKPDSLRQQEKFKGWNDEDDSTNIFGF